MEKLNIPELTGTNYFIWELKMKSALTLKRLSSVITEVKPENLSEEDSQKWNEKNSDAVAYIKLSLSDEQALQFANEENAKILWEKIKCTFTGQAEDRRIDAGNEIKNLEMKSNESANDFIARARGIATKCQSLGLEISPRELVFYTVRGLRGKFSRLREILKTQRDKTLDEVLEILREEELTHNSGNTKHADSTSAEVFFSRKNKFSSKKLCYVCRKPGHVAKNCFYKNKTVKNDSSYDNKQKKKSYEQKSALQVSTSENKKYDGIWILDSGASCHMAKDKFWFENIVPDKKEIFQAGKNSKLSCEGIGTVRAHTVSNSKFSVDLTINNVSYVPDLRNNLLSLTALMDKGCKIKSNYDCV